MLGAGFAGEPGAHEPIELVSTRLFPPCELTAREARGERLALVERRIYFGDLLGLAGLFRLRLVVHVGLAAEVEAK